MKKRSIDHISQKQLITSLYITQLFVVVLACVIGVFLFQDVKSFMNLFSVELKWIVVACVLSIIVVGLDIFMWNFLPKKYYDDGGINEKLFYRLPVYKIAIIALLVAICEEILFRAVLQTHIGLVLTSFIFAFVHFRYLKKWFLFMNVILLSFVIGLLYEVSNHQMVPVIVLHFCIDFFLGVYIAQKSYRN